MKIRCNRSSFGRGNRAPWFETLYTQWFGGRPGNSCLATGNSPGPGSIQSRPHALGRPFSHGLSLPFQMQERRPFTRISISERSLWGCLPAGEWGIRTAMTTIKDVARRAGVAPSTVSNYLTGNARVSPPTAKRIQEAIDELGYIPNRAARSLRVKHTNTLGLIVPDISNPFFSEIVRTINHVSQRMEYTVMLCDSGGDGTREKSLLANLLSQRVDGILMIHTGHRDDYVELATQASRPIVFVDRAVEGIRSVVTDNYTGGKLAARHLLGLGHTRFGILAGNTHVRNVQERLEGFTGEVEEHGYAIEPPCIISGEQTLETGREVDLLLKLRRPPTAIFATNDIIALGAWRKLPMGVRSGGLTWLRHRGPNHGARPDDDRQDKAEMGRQAVLALFEAMETKQ